MLNMTTTKTNGAYKSLINSWDKLTHINGMVTPSSIYKIKDELGIHWVKKMEKWQARQRGILNSGATSGAAPEEDMIYLDDKGEPSTKKILFPEKQTSKATKKMLLRDNMMKGAREINNIPGIPSMLVSVPKLADVGYMTIYSKTGAVVYNDETATITADQPPVMEAE